MKNEKREYTVNEKIQYYADAIITLARLLAEAKNPYQMVYFSRAISFKVNRLEKLIAKQKEVLDFNIK